MQCHYSGRPSALHDLRLSDNPWLCDKHTVCWMLRAFGTWIDENMEKGLAECSAPSALVGMVLRELTEQDINCDEMQGNV